MTRKRFIKNMMAAGYSRNIARECAEDVKWRNVVFQKANHSFKEEERTPEGLMRQLTNGTFGSRVEMLCYDWMLEAVMNGNFLI